MAELKVLRGIPGSGKSTIAKEWVSSKPESRVRVNRDDLRFMLFGMYWGLSYQQENDVSKAERALVETYLQAGKDVVVDNMHLRPKYVREWWELAYKMDAEFDVVEVHVDLATAITRDLLRDRTVGAKVITEMYTKLLPKGKFLPVMPPSTNEQSVQPYTSPGILKPYAIIVDVDGTVARMSGRSPFDWTRVSEDSPILDIIELVGVLREQVDEVIFMSGRSEECREDTRTWLLQRGVMEEGDALFMRAAGDSRADTITKYELFNNHVRGKYNISYVVDDRNSVVAMWRSLGLTCLQVAEGDF